MPRIGPLFMGLRLGLEMAWPGGACRAQWDGFGPRKKKTHLLNVSGLGNGIGPRVGFRHKETHLKPDPLSFLLLRLPGSLKTLH